MASNLNFTVTPEMATLYNRHVKTCRSLGVQPHSAADFLSDFMQAPESARTEIIEDQGRKRIIEPPRMSFPQYESPRDMRMN